MKSLLVLIFLLLAEVNFKRVQPDTKEYIRIENMGDDAKYVRPIYISKRKLDIKLQEPDASIFKGFQRNNIDMNKERFLNIRYNLLITDKDTYALLLSFITNHKEFYLNGIDRFNPTESSLDVLANGKTYSLFYKTEQEFFKELTDYLKVKNCDGKVIVTLGSIR